MGILTKPMKKFVLSETKKGYNVSEYNKRIKDYALKGLEDLTLLAQKLPEEQKAMIFDKETLAPFFKAIFNIKIQAKDHNEYLKIKASKDMVEERKRLLQLSNLILHLVGDYSFVSAIVPEPMKPFMNMGWPPLDNLKALVYTSMHEDEYLSNVLT